MPSPFLILSTIVFTESVSFARSSVNFSIGTGSLPIIVSFGFSAGLPGVPGNISRYFSPRRPSVFMVTTASFSIRVLSFIHTVSSAQVLLVLSSRMILIP